MYQEKSLRLQLLQQLLEQIQNNLQQLNTAFVELKSLKDSVENIGVSVSKNGEESIIQLYQGVFLKAKILSFDNFIVGVGKNVLVEKNRIELLEFLDKQIFDTQNNFESLNFQFEDLKKEYVSLYEDLRKIELDLR